MSDKDTRSAESFLWEYAAANDAYMHYDNFSWQVGAVLAAGAFVFWGFLLNVNVQECGRETAYWLFVASSILVSVLLSLWMVYSDHNRQIYLSKLDRLHEIEAMFGLWQHRRWKQSGRGGERAYRTYGLSGHVINTLIYVATVSGVPIIAAVKLGPSLWLWFPSLLLAMVTVIYVIVCDCLTSKRLRDTPGSKSQAKAA